MLWGVLVLNVAVILLFCSGILVDNTQYTYALPWQLEIPFIIALIVFLIFFRYESEDDPENWGGYDEWFDRKDKK